MSISILNTKKRAEARFLVGVVFLFKNYIVSVWHQKDVENESAQVPTFSLLCLP
jgi:hypothetical protein